MAKQKNYVRTQVRLDEDTYGILKEYAEKSNLSMNAAMNDVLYFALVDELTSIDTPKNKQMFIDITTRRLQTLTTKEVRDICGLVVHISQLKGH